MDHASAFLLLGALWALCIAIIWLIVVQIPRIRKDSPHAWRGPVSLLIGALVVAAVSVGIHALYRSGGVEAEVAAATATPISIDSDPQGAYTYLNGRYVGQTPVVVHIRDDLLHSYVIAADPREYEPFAGTITPETFGNIAVWLDRRGNDDQGHAAPTHDQVDNVVLGEITIERTRMRTMVAHRGTEPHSYVLITLAHFDAAGSHLGDSRALIADLMPEEERELAVANPYLETSNVELVDVTVVEP